MVGTKEFHVTSYNISSAYEKLEEEKEEWIKKSFHNPRNFREHSWKTGFVKETGERYNEDYEVYGILGYSFIRS